MTTMVTTEAVLAVIRASRPEMRSPHDRVAFALHAAFMGAGYALGATGSRAGSSNPGSELEEVAIDGWNQLEGAYAFRYFTDSKSLEKAVDVRCTVINELLMVDAMALGNDKAEPVHVEIRVNDYASDCSGTVAQQYKNVEGLVKICNTILEKLLKTKSQRGKAEDNPETSSYQPPYPSYPDSVFVSPIGTSDLMPGAGAGIFEPRRDAGFESGEAGNIVGPHHSMWNRIGTDGMRTDFPDGGVPVGPPGARSDPFGPPGVPGFEPHRFGKGVGSNSQNPGFQRFP